MGVSSKLMNAETIAITGGCHCGGIQYRLSWPVSAQQIPARSCSCSYCTRFAATWTSHPEARLNVMFGTRDQEVRYRFGTQTADFIFCRGCGLLCLAISRIDEHDYAVVNINTFSPQDIIPLDHSKSDFSGEQTTDRLTRRKRRWISTVYCQFSV